MQRFSLGRAVIPELQRFSLELQRIGPAVELRCLVPGLQRSSLALSIAQLLELVSILALSINLEIASFVLELSIVSFMLDLASALGPCLEIASLLFFWGCSGSAWSSSGPLPPWRCSGSVWSCSGSA